MRQELCPHEYHQFVDAFFSFNDVVTSCYGRNLLPQYKTSLINFKVAYLKLNISDTPKVHAVFCYIEEFCSLKNVGLARWSEQTTESLHQEFKKCWENYWVWDTEHFLYGERLSQAVQMFNSLNLWFMSIWLYFIVNLILIIFMLDYAFRLFYLFTLLLYLQENGIRECLCEVEKEGFLFTCFQLKL